MTEYIIKDIILIILAICIIYLLYKNRQFDNFETTQATIIDAVNAKYISDIDDIRYITKIAHQIITNNDNLSIPANKVSLQDFITTNNITVSGTINSYGNISTKSNINAINITSTSASSGNITASGTLSLKDMCIDSLCVSNLDFKKIIYSKKFEAGFATNNGFVACKLYEGAWYLDEFNSVNGRFSFGSNNTWDYIYVNKGWTITLFDERFRSQSNYSNMSKECSNLTDDIPMAFPIEPGLLGLQNKVSSYFATFNENS